MKRSQDTFHLLAELLATRLRADDSVEMVRDVVELGNIWATPSG